MEIPSLDRLCSDSGLSAARARLPLKNSWQVFSPAWECEVTGLGHRYKKTLLNECGPFSTFLQGSRTGPCYKSCRCVHALRNSAVHCFVATMSPSQEDGKEGREALERCASPSPLTFCFLRILRGASAQRSCKVKMGLN